MDGEFGEVGSHPAINKATLLVAFCTLIFFEKHLFTSHLTNRLGVVVVVASSCLICVPPPKKRSFKAVQLFVILAMALLVVPVLQGKTQVKHSLSLCLFGRVGMFVEVRHVFFHYIFMSISQTYPFRAGSFPA